MKNVAAAAIGAAAGLGTDLVAARRSPRQRVLILAGGLISAAAIYPLARRRRPLGAPLLREMAGVAAAGAVASTAARSTTRQGRTVVATGWAAHVLFDALHEGGEDSLIPDWYPALCAGYDLAVAGRLLTA